MHTDPMLFLFGSRRITVPPESRTAVMNLCLRHGLFYRGMSWEADGGFSFLTTPRISKRLQRLCQEEGIRITIHSPRGLPFLLRLLCRRAGLLIGLLGILLLLFLSQRFVWDIRVSGNGTMTTSEVLAELRACGLYRGAYLPSIQASQLENRVLIASDRIAWISVNMDGTVARVQIIESVMPPEKEPSRPANLVAAADGQIEFLELYRGNAVVSVGQAVRKGDLLVSGVYDSQTEGFRYTRAAGSVFARTERTVRIEIPLAYSEKTFGEAEYDEISFNFFDFSLKIFKRTGNSEQSCDIIEMEKGFDTFGLSSLPFYLTVTKRIPYVESSATRTHEQASALAYAALERELALFSEDLLLLDKRITVTATEDAVILDCTLYCIENIAVQAEFDVLE